MGGESGKGGLQGRQGKLPPNWLNLLLVNISDAVILTERDGIVLYWNKGAEKTFQYSSAEMAGQLCHILYPSEEYEEITEARSLALAGEVIHDLEVDQLQKDGKVITMLISIVPILGESGEVEYLALLGKDISVVRGLEEKALSAEKLETVKEMIVTINHRMNQPLAVAGCYLGMLQSARHGLAPEVEEQYLGEIEKALDTVAELLRKIADMGEIKTAEYLAENRMIIIDGSEEQGG